VTNCRLRRCQFSIANCHAADHNPIDYLSVIRSFCQRMFWVERWLF
jgi:hypothetical protein